MVPNSKCCSAECPFHGVFKIIAECRYAECNLAECRGAI
jgi:hypothetical protein